MRPTTRCLTSRLLTCLAATSLLLSLAACDDDPATPDTIADTGAPDTADTASDQTVTPDEGTPDVTPDVGPADVPVVDVPTVDVPAVDVAPAPKTCLDHHACLGAACATSAAGDLQTCFDGAAAGCGIVTDGSDIESGLATSLASCAATNGCVPDGTKAMFECLSDHCVPDAALCQAGEFGADNICFDLQSCNAVNCKPGITGVPDPACLRGCAADYTQSAVESFLFLFYCLEANCADAADKKVCIQQMQGNPLCSGPASNCVSL